MDTLTKRDLPDIARGFRDLCADLLPARSSCSFGPPDGSWIVVVGLTPARSAELATAIRQVVPKEDPIVAALRERVAELEAHLAQVEA